MESDGCADFASFLFVLVEDCSEVFQKEEIVFFGAWCPIAVELDFFYFVVGNGLPNGVYFLENTLR